MSNESNLYYFYFYKNILINLNNKININITKNILELNNNDFKLIIT